MISALAWVPPGASSQTPKFTDIPERALKETRERMKRRTDVEDDSDDDDDDDKSEEKDEEKKEEEDDDDDEEGMADEQEMKDALNDDDSEESESDSDVKEKKNEKKKAIRKAQAVANAARGITDDLAELDMDNYDNDDSYDEDIQERQLFGKMNSEFESNQDDPYVTIKDSDDDEEEENPDDFGILKNDLVVLAARAEEDASHLEVWVYQEAITNEETHETEANLYVHHDVMLPAFPLCLAWMDCCKDTGANNRGSYCAVGTMYPGIEIWDLDCIDAVEPAATLGGYDTADVKKSSSGGKSKPKVKKEGHQDAVLGMSWNSQFRNVLASASADKTVKIWDVSTETCTETLTKHTSKVQCLEWNPEERTVLVSGGFDKHARVCDVRAPKEASLDFNVGADCESVCWSARNPLEFFVSNENGEVACFDTRMASSNINSGGKKKSKKSSSGTSSAERWRIKAHEEATTSVSCCHGSPGAFLTSSTDGTLKLWDENVGSTPKLLAANTAGVGAVFCAGFSPHLPYLAAAAGSAGAVSVWDVLSEDAVRQSRHGPLLERYEAQFN
jgi:periodic tryptophan protein 1